MPPNRVSQILAGRRAITADTALCLACWFDTSAELWMNLQQTYELDLARHPLGAAIGRLPMRPPNLVTASTVLGQARLMPHT